MLINNLDQRDERVFRSHEKQRPLALNEPQQLNGNRQVRTERSQHLDILEVIHHPALTPLAENKYADGLSITRNRYGQRGTALRQRCRKRVWQIAFIQLRIVRPDTGLALQVRP